MTSPEWLAADEDDADRFPQTSHTSAQISPHSPDEGSRVVPDPARVARYAEAMHREFHGFNPVEAMPDSPNWRHRIAACYACTDAAFAVVALADEERADLVAEVERLKRGGKTLGEIIDKQCRMVLDATGLHDWVDEDGDGDWGAIWDHLFVLKSRAEAAEAKVAKFEALADGWAEHGEDSDYWRVFGPQVLSVPFAVSALRAVLADAPAERPDLDRPCACGHLLTDHLDGLACYAGTTVTSEFACDCREWRPGAPAEQRAEVCGHNVGDPPEVCRCLLPRGHSGMHSCKHTERAEGGA